MFFDVNFFGLGLTRERIDSVVLCFLGIVSSHGTSEDILVFLVWEVDVIVSMGVAVFCGVVSVILPGGIGSEVGSLSVFPGLELEIAN